MKQHFIPGGGLLFRPDGLPLEKVAALAHEHGFLSDEQFAIEKGVPALRRLLYDSIYQGIAHYPLGDVPDEGTRERRRRIARLRREANAYAEEIGVDVGRDIDRLFTLDDLDRFGIEATGRNLIAAELVATLMKLAPGFDPTRGKVAPSEETLRIAAMIGWVRAGRP